MIRALLFSLLLPAVAAAAPRPNVLLLCIDDLRPELHCYGVDWIHSPHIDKLAAGGRLFRRHYVQAPTCGASRCALLTGRYGGADNNAIFALAGTPEAAAHPSLPAHFRASGYTAVSVGKISHHPGGRGGPDWDDESMPEMPGSWDRHLLPAGPWQHPRGAMHGLANGEIRGTAGTMAVFQSTPGPDTTYPDGWITDESLRQMDLLAGERKESGKPFFLAVGIIRPHLPFGAPAQYREPYRDLTLPPVPHAEKPAGLSTWHNSGEFTRYDLGGRDPRKDAAFADEVRKHYAACVSYADAQVGRVLAGLDRLGMRENTIIVLWGDHGWHLGEHAVWGKHTLYEESLWSPLILATPALKSPGAATDAMVESLDLYPTLCALAGLDAPAGLDGRSLLPQLEDPAVPGHPAISYFGGNATIRTDSHRLILHRKSGKVSAAELYDHTQPDGETVNAAADHPDMVEAMTRELNARLRR